MSSGQTPGTLFLPFFPFFIFAVSSGTSFDRQHNINY
jgi:hypothetical protein